MRVVRLEYACTLTRERYPYAHRNDYHKASPTVNTRIVSAFLCPSSPLPPSSPPHLPSRHLLRSLAAARQGKRLSEAVSYLNEPSSSLQRPTVRNGSDLRRPSTLLWLFRGRARGEVVSAEAAVEAEGGRSGGGGASGGKEAMVQAAVSLGR